MRPTGAHRVLLERGELLSWLALPGMSDEQAAPAVERDSPDDGVPVQLVKRRRDGQRSWGTGASLSSTASRSTAATPLRSSTPASTRWRSATRRVAFTR